ncbi:MAG: AbrB/MazE/SpoVT family DNA-binding domain-containing protein [Thermomicrobiales bacterium]|nr:AbrB/MazE/SpoVT family DNA-binding domain-containing protein [Thermomicrobiales bacterium]
MKHHYYAKVTSKGQITVPKPIRDSLAIDSGDSVLFTVEDGRVTSVDAVHGGIEDLFGKFKPVPGADTSDFDRIRQDAWDQVVEDRIRRMNES